MFSLIQKKLTDVGVEKALDSKKVLQVVNLSPSESWVEKIVRVHPMRQIAYASIVQLVVFGSMFGCMAINEEIIKAL